MDAVWACGWPLERPSRARRLGGWVAPGRGQRMGQGPAG